MKKFLLAVSAVLLSATIAKAEPSTAQFTSQVVNREPVDALEVITKGNPEFENIVFYTVVRDMEGQSVSHVWKNGDVEIYKKDFNVGGPRWRVWSSVSNAHYEPGEKATAQLVDSDGNVILSKEIRIQ